MMRPARPLVLTASLAFVAGVPLAANGEVNTRIDIQVSSDGVNFSSSLGDWYVPHAEVRVTVSYTGTQAPVGLASLFFQPTVSEWNAPTDTLVPFANGGMGSNTSTPAGTVPDAPAAYGRLSPWARTDLATTSMALMGHIGTPPLAPATYLRIAQARATSWIGGSGNTSGAAGVPIGQLNNVGRTASDPAFSTQLTGIHVFRFGIDFAPQAAYYRMLVLDLPLSGFGNLSTTTGQREVHWWAGLDETSPSIRGGVVVNSAVIWQGIPAPPALVPLAAALMFRKRTRSGTGRCHR